LKNSNIKKYRKKPIVVEAVRWDGREETYQQLLKRWKTDRVVRIGENNSLFIHTPEGVMEAKVGDFVIRGIKGEIYPCKPDIFKETYEEVGDEIFEWCPSCGKYTYHVRTADNIIRCKECGHGQWY